MSQNPVGRPIAYSYLRFSTPEQAKGRSFERQVEAAEAYAREHGLELAELAFKDLGVSAFRGKNAQTGALRAFLQAVEEGEIPSGSYLLVESLDRITRNSIVEAQALFMLIVRAGITLVTLLDKRRYSLESINANPTDLIISIVMMMRGHEESATKARRLSDAYERKRKEAVSGSNGRAAKPFTRMLPAWIRWNEDHGKHELISERAKVIRRIFQKADAGWGQHRIAQWLNDNSIPTWGGKGNQRRAQYWHRSYVRKLLTNNAVIGTFTPHQLGLNPAGKRNRRPLEGIENYWPAAVDRECFKRVSSRAAATASRGRNALIEPASIFAGILKCIHCGGSVVRVNKGDYAYLICSAAHRRTNGCKYHAVPYKHVEDAMRRNAAPIFRHAPRGRSVEDFDKEADRLEELLSLLADEALKLTDELAAGPSESIRHRLGEKEAELSRTRDELRSLRARRDTLSGPYVQKRLKAVRDALRRVPFNIAGANRALKEAVSKITFDPDAGGLTIYWRHADRPQEGPSFPVRPFAN